MNTITIIAKKEIRDALRSSWLLVYGGLLALLALALSYLGQRNLGAVGFENFSRTTASLLNLCLLLAPMIALSMSAGAIAGERERGTLTYLLSQPIERWQLLLGKYAGLVASIGLMTVAGFGVAGLAIGLFGSAMQVGTYLLFVALVVGLVAVMTGVGLLASVVSSARVQALGLALLVWFALVFFFDLVLIGLVSSTSLGGGGLFVALLANPVEIVRVIAIIHLEPDLEILGPFGAFVLTELGTGGATAVLLTALLMWMAAPLSIAVMLFDRDSPRRSAPRMPRGSRKVAE